ncbi:hypothetical protein BD626DRAFT_415265 [Schizophyllum amplum]|uniref:C2H2-type domain-containing protein n=1 Tax=Schizophyllum amplum TaxID=97359 RepID=A0A550BTI7_9AGAR|nr:hypothetical protein BD626DRAFT_415265 [Auriculariopsis ampla]
MNGASPLLLKSSSIYCNPASPCDADGNPIPAHQPPEPRHADTSSSDWAPYDSGIQFKIAEFLFKKVEMSQGDTTHLMDLWAAWNEHHFAQLGLNEEDIPPPPFAHHRDLHSTIDGTTVGDVPWQTFEASFPVSDLPIDGSVPSWQTAKYPIWYRDPQEVVKSLLDNPDFDGEFDYVPFQEYDASGHRHYRDFFSGNWAYRQCDIDSDGATFVPIILGSDKTTVSVATGNNEYYPLYLSIGNIHNNVRRAHRNGLIPIAFLAIPKSDRKHDNDIELKRFRHQLFHASLAAILQPLKSGMTVPEVLRCPDQHYRRCIYGIGPYIADYPEQVMLSGIVQGWCPKCTALPSDLDGKGGPRTQQFTDELVKLLDSKGLWEEYGINEHIVPFTNDFPRADIHELISFDLLHQLIKGTFKDHLVAWVGEYLVARYGEAEAKAIMDDIDRRIAAAPTFPGLRRFPHGRRFKQWTGDDSKALMKVYLPAIVDYVEDEVVQCLSAFLDFCYIARRSDISAHTLDQLNDALTRFHLHRQVFERAGVRDSISLPRQHSMVHYHWMIQEFGSPNGLCSSITESRHITAVKKPWRRSSRYKALGQMLVTNERLDKLSAARTDFESRGMLDRPLSKSKIALQPTVNDEGGDEEDEDDERDGQAVDDARFRGTVVLPLHHQPGYPLWAKELATHVEQPKLPELIRRFLFGQLNSDDRDPDAVALEDCPPLPRSPIHVYHSAAATFYAPSDISGVGGMRREHIRSTPSWRKEGPRRDVAFGVKDKDESGFRGLVVLRVMLLFSFVYAGKSYPCALVQWFSPVGDAPDHKTGMWIVKPDTTRGVRDVAVVHLNALIRCAQLLPVFGDMRMPIGFEHCYTYDCFQAFYVNKYADHHTNEIVF